MTSSRPPSARAATHEDSGATMRDRWLPPARVGWMVTVLLILALFVAGIPESFVVFQTPCAGANCSQIQLSPEYVRALRHLGFSLGLMAAYGIALQGFTMLVSCAIATVIFWRRPDERVALLGAFMLVSFGGATFNDVLNALRLSDPFWWWPVTSLQCLGTASLLVFFYLFPDGRFVPRWTRWTALLWTVLCAIGYFSPRGWALNQDNPSNLFPLLVLGFFGSVVVAQVYRYRRVSTPGQRRQTKWVVLGFATALTGLLSIILFLPESSPGAGLGAILYLSGALFEGFLVLIPLSIGVAILRSGLWDIDVLVNRALVYGWLTASLLSVYFGGVVLLQRLFAFLIGEGSTLAVIVSTLVIAALFDPLRQRIQALVDRRFYRSKYDAQKTLEDFSKRLREETDLDALSDGLVTVVRETVQPARIALWLRPQDETRGERT